jgi:hypothetical protein
MRMALLNHLNPLFQNKKTVSTFPLPLAFGFQGLLCVEMCWNVLKCVWPIASIGFKLVSCVVEGDKERIRKGGCRNSTAKPWFLMVFQLLFFGNSQEKLFFPTPWLPVALNLAITDERFRVELNLIVAKMSTFRVPGGGKNRVNTGPAVDCVSLSLSFFFFSFRLPTL